jgi:hypothetical protein
MNEFLKDAKVQQETLTKRIHMLRTGVMTTEENIEGRPVDTTAKTLDESIHILRLIEELIREDEAKNAYRT